MAFHRFALAVGLLAVAVAAGAQTGARKTYIVQLADAPAATYTGSVAGLAATAPVAGAKLDARAPNVRAYTSFLSVQRANTLAKVGNIQPLHQYDLVFNGFSAQLTDAQVQMLKTTSGVVSVTPDQLLKLDTTRTPSFLGLTTAGGLHTQSVTGENVIIGVLDTGAWPENPSFGDKVDALGKPVAYNQPGTLVYGPPPAKWAGTCQTGPGFTAAMCNNKLVGARFFTAGFNAGGGTRASLEYLSPRDGDGHGSHTASTSGGNAGVAAGIDGVAAGVVSGIAPRARLAAYKVCWTATVASQTGCYQTDTIAAINAAIADGVDVINFSVGGTKTNYVDPVEIAYLNATAAGVFVAVSAGNDGDKPPPTTQFVSHMSPWLMTVAASTHDRFTTADVTLGAPSGAVFNGPSYQGSGLGSTPLIMARDAGINAFASLSTANKRALMRCLQPADYAALGATADAALDPAKVAGKMVVCLRGDNVLVNKAAAVKAAGGAAMIILNHPALADPAVGASSNSTVLQPYVIPAVHLTASAYPAVAAYAATAGATASFGPGVQVAGVVAPVHAAFSSRGPSQANGNILKPDVTAPGVDIIAGYVASLTQTEHDNLVLGTFTPPANAAALQGTSMASPHVAGAAALLRQLYPTWSPAAIKSALMTTTTIVKNASGTTDTNLWNNGAGHINPNGAANPGLVYDAAPADYGRFLCGLGLTPPAGIGTCAGLGSISPWNLNLASLTASDVPGTITLTRRVTNVTGAAANFTATASLAGWSVVVAPANLALAAGETKSFTVTLTRTTAAVGAYTFGDLTWSDGVRSVKSPLSARAISFSAPATVTDTRASGSGSKSFPIVSADTGPFSVVPTGLVPATVNNGQVADNQTQCFNAVVPAGALLARFQLFNADTQGGAATDIDLEVFNGPDGTGSVVGASGSGTSDELVQLNAPTAGTYSACAIGYATHGLPGGAMYKLSSWVVGPAVGVQTLRAFGPSNVTAGGIGTIGLSWAVPAGQRYLGALKYKVSGNPVGGTTTVMVDNH